MKASSQSSLVLSADFPCMYLLAEALAQRGATTAVRLLDYHTFHRDKPRWIPSSAARLQRKVWLFPPGYGGKFERLCRPWVSWHIARAVREISTPDTGSNLPWVIAPFPYLTASLRSLPPARIIYYNLDDYSLYPKGWPPRLAALEDELVERSELVVCASSYQMKKFRRRFPHRRVEHLPLAVPLEFLNHEPKPPANDRLDVGYVGTLNDRVDWQFCGEVAARCPQVRFTFVGPLHDASPRGGKRGDWMDARGRVLARPNVRYISSVPHSEVVRFYREFSVSWIPYDTEHLFNIACCPTKIMDGLAAGRPILSTDLPECRLYPEWITVVKDVAQAAQELERLRGVTWERPEQARAGRQVACAETHTWRERVKDIAAWMAPASKPVAGPVEVGA